MAEVTTATERDKWIDAITKLIRLTQRGEIKWLASDPSFGARPDLRESAVSVFKTSYEGYNLRLTEAINKIPATLRSPLDPLWGKADRYEPAVYLEFIDEKGTSLWTYPSLPSLKDLLSAVKYQSANVDSFFDAIAKVPA